LNIIILISFCQKYLIIVYDKINIYFYTKSNTIEKRIDEHVSVRVSASVNNKYDIENIIILRN